MNPAAERIPLKGVVPLHAQQSKSRPRPAIHHPAPPGQDPSHPVPWPPPFEVALFLPQRVALVVIKESSCNSRHAWRRENRWAS